MGRWKKCYSISSDTHIPNPALNFPNFVKNESLSFILTAKNIFSPIIRRVAGFAEFSFLLHWSGDCYNLQLQVNSVSFVIINATTYYTGKLSSRVYLQKECLGWAQQSVKIYFNIFRMDYFFDREGMLLNYLSEKHECIVSSEVLGEEFHTITLQCRDGILLSCI